MTGRGNARCGWPLRPTTLPAAAADVLFKIDPNIEWHQPSCAPFRSAIDVDQGLWSWRRTRNAIALPALHFLSAELGLVIER